MNWPAELLGVAGLICLIAAVALWNPLVGLGFTGLVLFLAGLLLSVFGGASNGDDIPG